MPGWAFVHFVGTHALIVYHVGIHALIVRDGEVSAFVRMLGVVRVCQMQHHCHHVCSTLLAFEVCMNAQERK